MYKNDLRKIFKEKRLALHADEQAQLNSAMEYHFAKWLAGQSFHCMMSYVPFQKHNEPNPQPLEAVFLIKNTQAVVCFPKMEGDEMAPILPKNQNLAAARFGILEYQEYTTIDPLRLDIVLVPMLVSDLRGHRVGYGKGFYDRFLPLLREDCIKIGISFFPPIDQIADVHAGDQPLDYCLHPDGLTAFD